MTNCDICSILENKDMFKFVYEDDTCFAILHESPAVPGHTLVIPKKHTPIIEELDDAIVEHLFVIANKVSSAIFDSVGAQGTNILVNNGLDAGQELPHVVINVLPRKENDPLNFEWQPKKSSESELKTTQSMIKVYSEHIISGKDKLPDKPEQKPETPQAKIEARSQESKQEIVKQETDYLVKGLKRIP